MPDVQGALSTITGLTYLLAAALFILGLRRLGSPETARSGNVLGATGMLIAVVVTLLDRQIVDFVWIIVGVVVGGAIGGVLACTIKMTAMPQMVALFNGFGGGASVLVASGEFIRLIAGGAPIAVEASVTIMLSLLIGSVTFSGSLVAFGKLQELITERAVKYPLQKSLNLLLFLVALGLAGYLVATGAGVVYLVALVGVALVLGVLLVLPIGGADMPVVIALLNSYSGLAAATTGFVLDNNMLIIAGSLVGASGFILTRIMTRAMNRSLVNVIFGTMADAGPGASRDQIGKRPVRDTSAEDAAVVLAYARHVIVVPGYGLAVSQAQHHLRELGTLLEARGVRVSYAIHPVAGRMPGHMNVLLAEADVPYDRLYDLDSINDEFDRADVAMVVGANDVVNPAARDQADSPIYGMPILNVDRSASVLVLKRSLSPGFAGIDNDLFYMGKTMMLFGDAKESIIQLSAAVKSA
jgi:NAD(P) transhydrogenase subunit beta